MKSPNQFRVVFDISALGAGFSGNHNKRGIYRVVENTLDALREKCEIELSASENSYLARHYLATRPDLQGLRFHPNGPTHRLLGPASEKIEACFIRNAQDAATNRALHRRLTRRGIAQTMAAANSLLRKRARFPLEDTDIFHQPGPFPMPDFVTKHKKKGFSRFMTIYDFIPFTDETSGKGHAQFLRKVLDTLGKDDFAICISSFVRDEACEMLGISSDRIFVAPLAAAKETFHPCLDETRKLDVRSRFDLGEEPYFLTLCALDPRKNIHALIEAFAAVCRENPSMKANLVLAGSVSTSAKAHLVDYGRSLGIENRIILTGFMAEKDLAPLYSGAMAFVFPSLAEGFGLPPLEAMQCGTPVISSNLTSLPEVVGDAGILIDPRVPDALGAAMSDLYESDSLRRNLSQKGLERSAMFSWEKCADDHLTAYRAANR